MNELLGFEGILNEARIYIYQSDTFKDTRATYPISINLYWFCGKKSFYVQKVIEQDLAL